MNEDSFRRYTEAGLQAGCPRDQLFNLIRVGIVLQPRQLAASAAARLCDEPDGPTEIGFGGARGGGKSHWLLAQMAADDCQRVPGLKCLLLRKVGKANLEHFEDLRRTVLSGLPHEFARYRGILTFPNSSRIVAGHFQSESDIDQYLGLEYDVIGVEEATTLSQRKYEHVTTCCRSSKRMPTHRHWRPRVYTNSNPGGIGHAWYRSRFIVPYTCARESETRFIRSLVSDNQFSNPEYRRVLEKLTGWQRRAWLQGDWDITAGQFFTTFRSESHVIETFDDRKASEWLLALDYGFTHYTVALLGCRDTDGNIYIVGEHAERLWLPERHMGAIAAMLARHDLELHYLTRAFAGADIFARESDGNTIAGQYRDLGLDLRPANTQRVAGWAAILSLLGDPAAGIRPRLFIHQRCRRHLDTLPYLQHDPARPEDVLKVDATEDGIGGDDAADALRYLVSTPVSRIDFALA